MEKIQERERQESLTWKVEEKVRRRKDKKVSDEKLKNVRRKT